MRLASMLAILWLGGATGAAEPGERVVLADGDRELRHAMERALAPWHLQIMIDGAPPPDAFAARERAVADSARFVVWRDEAELVVFDRELGSMERRPSRSGQLDAPTAASAALTLKTMMRLPPPADDEALPVTPGWIRLQAGLSSRIASGETGDVSARFAGAVTIRPWATTAWRFGLEGDGGTATSVSRAGFKGSFGDWSLLAIASLAFAPGSWEIEPHAGVGLRRSSLDGTEMGGARDETALLGTLRGGVWLRWRSGPVSVGIALDGDLVLDAPTYTKLNAPALVFQVPGSAIELGAVVGLEWGSAP